MPTGTGPSTASCALPPRPCGQRRRKEPKFLLRTTFTAENTPFGSNATGANVAAGQFNYLLLYEGAPTGGAIPSGTPTVRMQLGPDIDMAGNVINNAMGPFPTGPVPNAPELSGGANAFAAPGQIDLTLTGFSPLSGGSYQLWVYGSGSYAAVDATIYPDGDMDMMMMGSTFSPSSSEDVYHAKMEASMDLNFGDFSHVAVSAESGTSGSPSGGPFLFQEYLTSDNLMQQGAMTFGSMGSDGAITPFSAGGSGTASFYETSLLVDLRRLPAPPPGLHYQSYLVSFTGPAVTNSARGNTITLDARGNGADRLDQGAIGDFGSFSTYLLVLEPDGIQSITEMRVQQSDDYTNKFKEFFGG